jgi:hypothetical protein
VFRRQQATSARPYPRHRRRRSLTAVGCAAVALVSAGCGSTAPPPPAARAVKGTVLTLVTASSIGPYGQPKGISQYFPVEYRQVSRIFQVRSVTAVALVGRLAHPTTLVMTWSRLTTTGAQLLFTRQMTVTSYGLAYSTAQTAGTLPFGIYRVVASIGASRRVVTWTIYTPAGTTTAEFIRSQKPLTPGPSGAFPEHPPLPELCSGIQSIVSMSSVDDVNINVAAYCPQTGTSGPVRGAELATMNRNDGLQLIGRLHLQPGGMLTGNFLLNVCKLPESSDLPGTSLYLSSIIYFHGGTRDFAGYFDLPADHSQPRVTITSSVPPGTAVHPGERIMLRITAIEAGGLGPQIGVRFLRLKGPEGRIASRSFGRPAPGCDNSRLRRQLAFVYRVPANAPKVLTLTAVASDTPSGGSTQTISFPVSG